MFKTINKIPHVSESILLDLEKTKTYSRKSTVLPGFVNRDLTVHNGKVFIKLKITKAMVGYKLGEFIPTRKKFSYKKKKKKKWAKK